MLRGWSVQAAINAIALVLPIIAAVGLCYQLALNDQRARAGIMAEIIAIRAELTSTQLATALERLATIDPASACTPETLATMRSLAVASSMVQGLGYLEGDALRCSTLGAMGVIDVGPADYTSAASYIFRRQRNLPIAPDTPLLLVTGQSGYTGMVHPTLIFDLMDQRDASRAGIVTNSTRETILFSGGRPYDWSDIDMPDGQRVGTVVIGDEIVAWLRSSTRDQFYYAAIPYAAAIRGFGGTLPFYILGGIMAGLSAFWVSQRLATNRASLPTLLRQGLARDEIHTVYQPIVDMRTGRWVGAEALARWRRPTGEWIGPDVFVPIAERFGLMRQLTRRVMTCCAEDLAAFVTTAPDFYVSINVSAIDLQDPDFADIMAAECDARNIQHGRVHLEITERVEVDPAAVADAIRRLTQHGFEVGIDDFGIGYSNLSYLDNLDVDYLKVDKAFVAGIANGAIGTAIVDHIIVLGRERGLTIIAEGVEGEEQRRELVARGVVFGQGWLFGRPMPPAALLAAYSANQSETGPAAGMTARRSETA